MRDGWLRRDGVDLHYLEWGVDEDPAAPAILLLHGLGSNARYWERTARHLAGLRLVALDQRGHGLTGAAKRQPPAPEGYATDELIGDAIFVIDRLELDRPVVAGHSWGAAVGLEVAARRPDVVSGLVFVDGPLLGISHVLTWEEVESIMQPPLPRYTSIDDAIADSKRDLGDAWDDDLVPFVEARATRDGEALVLTLTSPVRHALLRGMFETNAENLWSRITVPAAVLVAHHREPRISRASEAGVARLAQIAPAVHVERFDTPHDIPLFAPAGVARQIEAIARHAIQERSTI